MYYLYLHPWASTENEKIYSIFKKIHAGLCFCFLILFMVASGYYLKSSAAITFISCLGEMMIFICLLFVFLKFDFKVSCSILPSPCCLESKPCCKTNSNQENNEENLPLVVV